MAGDINANNIAKWDGIDWQTVGSGVKGCIYSITVFNGELIAAGEISMAGGLNVRSIARWNGSTWNSIGSFAGGLYKTILALTVYDAELIIGGYEFYYSCMSRAYIASWDGISSGWWKALGDSVMFVNTFAIYNDKLISGCNSVGCVVSGNIISQWDGSSWQQFPCGVGCVHALTVYNGDLIVGGNNDCSATGEPDGCMGYGFRRWDGSGWH